jgi:hypothetical protein
MNRVFLFLALTIGITGAASAQNVWDGLRLSQTQYEGTARFTAMGGAFAALGGDFTTLSINPAGIGVYRGTELTFSLGFNHGNTDAHYLGSTVNDSYVNVGVNNLGLVFGSTFSGDEGLLSLNWGFGYNKLHNVTNRRITAQGTSENSSMLTGIADKLNTKGSSLHGLAWDTYLVNEWTHEGLTDTTSYIKAATERGDIEKGIGPAGRLKQSYYAEQSGYTGEYVFSLGGNISNKFYFGFTFGLQIIRNEYYKKYAEKAIEEDFNNFEEIHDDEGSSLGSFRSFTYSEHLNTSGTGNNIKLGIIWKPVAGLRWGAYFHSPTWIYLTERFSDEIASSFSVKEINSHSNPNEMEYKIVTPVKWGMGLAYTFGHRGLVSVDYEGADYSALSMYGYEDDYYVKWVDAAEEAREKFKTVTNIRAGGEYRIDQYALRAGYAYYGSPVKNDNSYVRHIISAGVGAQWGGCFMDAVYSFSPGNKETLSLYTDNNILKNTNFAGKFVVTLGFRF